MLPSGSGFGHLDDLPSGELLLGLRRPGLRQRFLELAEHLFVVRRLVGPDRDSSTGPGRLPSSASAGPASSRRAAKTPAATGFAPASTTPNSRRIFMPPRKGRLILPYDRLTPDSARNTAMMSCARSIPARVNRRRRHHRSAAPVHEWLQLRPISRPDVDAVSRLHLSQVDTPSVSRSPVNSASSARSSGDSSRPLRMPELSSGVHGDDVLGVDDTFRQRTPARVEWAPRPEAEPLPIPPVFQVVARPAPGPWRRSRSRTARSRRAPAAPSTCRYISATSSSGATDHSARAIRSRAARSDRPRSM